CKSPKLPGANFPAARQSDPRSSIDIASIALARSPVSLSSDDEVPHIFTRNSRLRSGEFLITSAKRLFQQHRSKPEITASQHWHPLHPSEQTFNPLTPDKIGTRSSAVLVCTVCLAGLRGLEPADVISTSLTAHGRKVS